ncbi:MAG: DUF3419 family protein, partial [Bacteroidota bacterium]
VTEGPYELVRNPIYLADFWAICGFAMCLPPVGMLLPGLFYVHYLQLIKYEEESLSKQFSRQFRSYVSRVPRLIPSPASLRNVLRSSKDFQVNRDGFRHNALFVLFIPGFILAAFTHEFLHAVLIGLPGVIDWAIIHTRIGISKKRPIGKSASSPVNVKPSRKKVFQDILYAQCWEDPQIDRAAFRINPDDTVFSITSGGCNVLTFLLDNPRKVIALDVSPYQNFLLDLKIAAFKGFSYGELLEFVGVRPSQRRFQLYERVRHFLKKECRSYWDRQRGMIELGIIHCGRYERYMRLLRRVITVIMGRQLIEQFFLIEDSGERLELYRAKWENARWRLFTRALLSRTVMTLLFDSAFFAYLDEDFSFGRHFAKKIERAFTQLPTKTNYFLAYIALGRFLNENDLPPYLRRDNFDTIRSRVDRIELVTDSCEHFFEALPDASISKFNFTNIFEWMSSEAYEALLKETVRVAKNKAIITYRNLLVFREHPVKLEQHIRSLKHVAEKLHHQDLSFIYDNYVVEEIYKEVAECNIPSRQYHTVER